MNFRPLYIAIFANLSFYLLLISSEALKMVTENNPQEKSNKRKVAENVLSNVIPVRDVQSIVGEYLNVWEVYKILDGNTSAVNSVKYSPDGRYLASGLRDGKVIIRNAITGEIIKILSDPEDNEIISISYSPDGRFLSSATRGNQILIWDLNTETVSNTINNDTQIRALAYSLDGKYLAFTSEHEGVKIWDVNNQIIRKTLLLGPNSDIWSIAFEPRLPQPDDLTITKTMSSFTSKDRLSDVTFDKIKEESGARHLASGSRDGNIIIWDINTGQQYRTFSSSTNAITSLAYSQNGRSLASESLGSIDIWDVRTGKLVKKIDDNINISDVIFGIWSIAFSPDGKYIASGSRNSIKIWDIEKENVLKYFGIKSVALSVDYSPDGNYIAAGLTKGQVQILHNQTGTLSLK